MLPSARTGESECQFLPNLTSPSKNAAPSLTVMRAVVIYSLVVLLSSLISQKHNTVQCLSVDRLLWSLHAQYPNIMRCYQLVLLAMANLAK